MGGRKKKSNVKPKGSPSLKKDEGKARSESVDPAVLQEQLFEEFRDLDQSLILAITLERNIQTEYEDIRDILKALAQDASCEQASTSFDPSGLGMTVEGVNGGGDEPDQSIMSESWVTENATTISDSVFSSGSSSSEDLKFCDAPDLNELDKVERLLLVFPNFKEHTLKFVLKQNGGDLDAAFDDLLTRQHLHETGQLPKGLDGFYEPQSSTATRRGKNKSKDQGGSKGKAKLALNYAVVSATVNDEELEGAKGPVRPSGSSAHRVTTSSATQVVTSTSVSMRRPSLPTSPDSEYGVQNLYAQASALARKGPLGRQGAVVYTERAREEARAAAERISWASEQLVDQKSTYCSIDLHGVTVIDGVRIAKDRVWRWWNNLGEHRQAKAKLEGFTVVTGVGRHSSGGISRLRQAVGAALKNDGWKVETLTGQFYVTGRV
ncbi:hypothetical protein B0T20DRAFT_126533 [Sordaria brevicollis]|uniref:Smr domain-containing protein n=1 Tax=Sordaria brevicollis TaxID=83679 RepID=A0AAE0UFW7_SORBR|nr:hypothetical protein B0T20DRAFT_126533 [Sordaria brevicollis]